MTSSGRVTSAAKIATSSPASVESAARSSSTARTRAPRSARTCTTAMPMSLAAPVTTATLPVRDISISWPLEGDCLSEANLAASVPGGLLEQCGLQELRHVLDPLPERFEPLRHLVMGGLQFLQ